MSLRSSEGDRKPCVEQFVERAGVELALGHPRDGLDVAQAARAGFDVGLQVVGRVVGLGVPFLLLGHLGFEVGLDRPDALGRHGIAHLREQLRVAGQQPRLHQRGHHADVGGTFLGAFVDGAHAVADLEIDVPQEGHQPFDQAAAGLIGCRGDQDQDVDVGMRMQLAAPVTADGRQCPAREAGRQLRAPHLAQDGVDELGARVHQGFHRFVGAEALHQLGVRVPELGAERVRRELGRRQALGQLREP